MTTDVVVRDLGLTWYEPVFHDMQAFTEQRDRETPDEIWFTEHEPVFTQGQAGKKEHLLAPGGIPVIQTDRGGQVTYHGPGQIVLYPILNLRDYRQDLHWYLRGLEEVVIRTVSRLGIGLEAERLAGPTGVWG